MNLLIKGYTRIHLKLVSLAIHHLALYSLLLKITSCILEQFVLLINHLLLSKATGIVIVLVFRATPSEFAPIALLLG